MPGNNWPAAVKNDRVYKLDGTMNPNSGIDWFESRVAEPDGMCQPGLSVTSSQPFRHSTPHLPHLYSPSVASHWSSSPTSPLLGMLSDLIKVLHPTGSNYAPSGMHFLRHASTGTSTTVTGADCVNPLAPRPIQAATCVSLDVTDPTAEAPVVDTPTTDPTTLAGSSDGDDGDNTGLHVAIGVLAGVTVITLVIMAAVYMHMQKKYAANEKAAKGNAVAAVPDP